LVEPGSLYGFLAEHRLALFPEEGFADLFPSGRGRPSVAGSVMGVALLLQAMENLTDREAAGRLKFDLRWKAACGLAVDEPAPNFSVLCVWRRRIAESGDPDRVFGMVGAVVKACGALRGRRRRVADSTVVDDAVARQDTVTMLIWQVHRIRGLFGGLREWIDCLPGRAYYEGRSKPDIDWDDPLAREDLVTVLVNDAFRIVERAWVVVEEREAWLEAQEGLEPEEEAAAREAIERLKDHVGLLALLAGQDVELADGSTDQHPRWRIAKKVAPDRVISTVDTQSRHVRKSRASKKDGYKAHTLAEPDTGLIVEAGASMGAGPGSSDAQVGQHMLTSHLGDHDSKTPTSQPTITTTAQPGPETPQPDDPKRDDSEMVDSEMVDPEMVDPEMVDSEMVDSEPVDSEAIDSELVEPEPTEPELVDSGGSGLQFLADSAYDSYAMLACCDELGVEPVIKPRPLRTAVQDGVSIDDFDVGCDERGSPVACCPGGFTVALSEQGRADFTDHCHRCVIKDTCTKAANGRIITLGEAQQRRRAHRQAAKDPQFQATYRQHRPMAERAISWTIRPGRRTPYRGVKKTDAWIKLRAAASNVKRLLSMGLTLQGQHWELTNAPPLTA